jgi:hypothetical protein
MGQDFDAIAAETLFDSLAVERLGLERTSTECRSDCSRRDWDWTHNFDCWLLAAHLIPWWTAGKVIACPGILGWFDTQDLQYVSQRRVLPVRRITFSFVAATVAAGRMSGMQQLSARLQNVCIF